jgi:hypothetical protein
LIDWSSVWSSLKSKEDKMGTKYTEADAAKDTDSTEKEATAAHHQARDDSGVREGERGGSEGLTKGQQAELQGIESEHGMPDSSEDDT